MKYLYYVVDPTSAPLENLFGNGYERTSHKDEAQIILIRSSDFKIEDFKNCETVVRLGTNTENINTHEMCELNIPIFYAPGANASSVAQAVTSICLSRQMLESHEWTKTLPIEMGKKELKEKIEKEKKQFLDSLLDADTNVGIIGACGNIGTLLPQYLSPYGVSIYGNDLSRALDKYEGNAFKKAYYVNEIAEKCRIITSHVSGHEKVLFGEHLDLLQENSILIDFARGESYDLSYLPKVIEGKNIKLHTDFSNHQALSLQKKYPQNVFCYSHVGGLTYQAEENCAKLAIPAVVKLHKTGKYDHALCKNYTHFVQTVE